MTYRADLAGLRHIHQVINEEMQIALSSIGLRERKFLSEGNAYMAGPIGKISFEFRLKKPDPADDDDLMFCRGSIYNDSADAPCNAKKSRTVIYREVSYGHVVVDIPHDYWQESDREESADMLTALAWIHRHVFPPRPSFGA